MKALIIIGIVLFIVFLLGILIDNATIYRGKEKPKQQINLEVIK